MRKRFRNRKITRSAGLHALLLCVMVCCLLCVRMTFADASSSQQSTGEKNEKELVIEVVDDLPAVEIEDEEVPLAAVPPAETSPDTSSTSAASQTIMLDWIPVVIIVAAAAIWLSRRIARH